MAHLSSVRLRGFKTFARPTELILQPGITVVIGPNGSGKSNIADAVLWVLGEQSPGNLRGRSMQDVIFTGPDGRKSSAVAEVSLTFDNECGSLPLDCAQVEVTRRLVRDGSSEYRLNGSPCRLLDVQDLVGGLGLGREMHSVISQGKVEALLNSTPEARRALVEEAAGLGRFKKRRERARVKLDRTRQNLLRVSDVEREVKNSLRPLRQQAAAAERFAQAMEEWALARTRLVVFELVASRMACRQTEDSLGGLSGRRSELEAGLAALRRQRSEEEEHFTAVLRSREDLGAAYHRVRAEAERLEARAVALRQRVARNEGELDRSRRRRDLAESELAALDARMLEMGTVTADGERLRRVSEAGQSLRAELDRAVPAYREALGKEDDLKDAVFELEAARSRALQDRDYLRREVDEKGRLGQEIRELARTAATKVGELDKEAVGRQEQLARLKTALLQAMEALQSAVKRRDEARMEEQEASREEARVAELLAGIQSRRGVLQDLLRRREGTSSGAQELMRDLEGSRLLAEVLTVEPGFERALAAALGPIVQAVILAGPVDAAAALRGAGPREVIWGAQDGASPAGHSPVSEVGPPAGTRDLWDVVSGPEAVIRTLKALVAPTAVLGDDREISVVSPAGGSWAGWRIVTKTGEVMTAGLHAARRTEAGAEALLRARNELAAVDDEQAALGARKEGAREATLLAAHTAREAEILHRRLEEELRDAERAVLSFKNEADLQARRLEEARSQVAELHDRAERELRLVAQMDADLAEAESVIIARESELEEARASLRGVQGRLESLRRDVTRLEEKKGQAALLEVRLKERCRAQESERQRALSQRETAAAAVARSARRMELTADYAPALVALLEVVEKLAETSRQISHDLDRRVEEARSRSESAAKVIRDWGGAEADLQRELDETTNGHTQLQVDKARLDDRRVLLEDELAELRRKHMAPRSVTPEDVSAIDKETLESALARAEQRKERIGPVNPLAEQECAEMEERARFLTEQRRDLEASIAQLQDVTTSLDEHINSSFDEIFESIKENFAAVIATVFPGAKGSLALTEGKPAGADLRVSDDGAPEDALESLDGAEAVPGISLSVKFPNKSPRSMSLLSGGEKAMTAIAFLFSLFLARPCPFYILDEVEASLDDVNIRRFLSLIRKYRDRTQFIVITHQRQTMEVADTLYGVALDPDGTSRVLSRKLGDKKSARDEREHPHYTEPVAKEA